MYFVSPAYIVCLLNNLFYYTTYLQWITLFFKTKAYERQKLLIFMFNSIINCVEFK